MKVLVTGAASGIGKATTEKLNECHNVVAFDIDAEGLQQLLEDVEKIEGDARNEEQVKEVLEDIEFDVLVNCAGFYELGAIEDMEEETVRKIFDTNVHGYLNFIRNSMPMLRERNGRVVNVSSVAGRMSMPFYGVYCGSKHAVEAISDALRMEAKESGVEVVIVEPGPVETGFNERARQALGKYVPDSFYSESYEERMGADTSGATAEEAAEKVVKAVTAENPSRRYIVTIEAWLAPKLKRLLPQGLWYRLVRKVA